MTAPTRVLELDACVNFRDLGGYSTVDGRRVRWRRVFRSDTLHRLERGSAERLEAELGIRTAIDLRAYDEIERAGIGHLGDVDVTYVHLPKDLAAAPAHAMEGLLVGLRDRYGSVDACAEAMGVDAAARSSLRESLLEPGT